MDFRLFPFQKMICKKNRGWFTHCKPGRLAGPNVFLTQKMPPRSFAGLWATELFLQTARSQSLTFGKNIWQLAKCLVVYPPSRDATGKYRFSPGSMWCHPVGDDCKMAGRYIDPMWMPIQGDGLLWYLTWPYLTWFDTEKTTAVCMLGSWSCGWKKSCKGAGILWIHISRKDSPNV